MRAGWWWIDRWRKSTAYTDMTLAEQGAYRNLLDELWLRGGVLPNDDRILGRASGDSVEWPTVRTRVLAHLKLTPDGYRNSTHDEVAAMSLLLAERQAEKGRRRASLATRGPVGRFQPDQPNHQPGQPDHQPNHQPDTSQSTSRATSLPSPSPYVRTGSVRTSVGAEPTTSASAPTAVLAFPVNGGSGPWALTQHQVDDWLALYPGLDVLAECRKALAYVRAATGHRKTARGMPRFLVAWLNRTTDRGPRQTVPAPETRTRQPIADVSYAVSCRLHGHAPTCTTFLEHRARLAHQTRQDAPGSDETVRTTHESDEPENSSPGPASPGIKGA